MYNDIGSALAIIGTIISIAGTVANNVWHKHILAMKIWMVSNILLVAWSIGNTLDYWSGGLSGIALTIMYSIFTISGGYGLYRYYKDGENKDGKRTEEVFLRVACDAQGKKGWRKICSRGTSLIRRCVERFRSG